MPGIQNSKSTLAYLGTIGTKDRGDAMPATAKALVELAGFLIETATDNLERKGNMATGGTAESMKIVNVDLAAPKMSLDVQILKTYKFLDQGVKGVKSGAGKYSFKNKYVGYMMANAIEKWLRKRGSSGRIKYKAVSKTERKNKRIHKTLHKVNDITALAFAVSTNIKKKGIKRTLFFTNAIKATQKELKKKFASSLKIDIINSINGN